MSNMVTPLINVEMEKLLWRNGFSYPNMVRIRTDMDGSCFFHAIAKSYCKTYIEGKINDMPINRRTFIRDLRKDLANMLGERIEPNTELTFYESLSRGQFKNFGIELPQYNFENMKNLLDSDQSIGNEYNEFISNVLHKDIYILDALKQDVYITGNDDDILYKGRESIVILFIPGHYELLGIQYGNNIQTLFDYNHPFIHSIRSRIRKIRNHKNF